MEHKANWQDWGARWSRRNAFMRNLKSILEELEVGYSMPVQPIFVQSSSSTAACAMTEKDDIGNAGKMPPELLGKAPGPSIRVAGDSF